MISTPIIVITTQFVKIIALSNSILESPTITNNLILSNLVGSVVLMLVAFYVKTPVYPCVDLFLAPFLGEIAHDILEMNQNVINKKVLGTLMGCQSIILGCSAIFKYCASFSKIPRIGDYIPYPVLCGWMTSSAIYLIKLGWQLVNNTNEFIVAIVISLVYYIGFHKTQSPFLLPLIVLFTSIVNYVLFNINESITLNNTNSTIIHTITSSSAVPVINFNYIFSQMPKLLVISVLWTIRCSLHVHSLAIQKKITKKMLMGYAGADALSAFIGGASCVPDYFLSSELERFGQDRVKSQVYVFLGLIVLLLIGGQRINYIPRYISSGVLISQAIRLFMNFTITPFRLLIKHKTYLVKEGIIIIIVVLMFNFFGMLYGVSIGVLASIVLFCHNYINQCCIKFITNGSEFPSSIIRRGSTAKYLFKNGHELVIIILQGIIFFGNLYQIKTCIQKVLPHNPKIVIMSMSLVTHIDMSAIDGLLIIKSTLDNHNIQLRFANANHLYNLHITKYIDIDLDTSITRAQNFLLKEYWMTDPIHYRIKNSLQNLNAFKRCLAMIARTYDISLDLLDLFPYVTVDEYVKGEELGVKLFFLAKGFIQVYNPRTLVNIENPHECNRMSPGGIVGLEEYLNLPNNNIYRAYTRVSGYTIHHTPIYINLKITQILVKIFYNQMLYQRRRLEYFELLESSIPSTTMVTPQMRNSFII